MCGCDAIHPGDDSRGFWGDVTNLQAKVLEVLDKIDGGEEDLGSDEAYETAVMRAFPLLGSRAVSPDVKRRRT